MTVAEQHTQDTAIISKQLQQQQHTWRDGLFRLPFREMWGKKGHVRKMQNRLIFSSWGEKKKKEGEEERKKRLEETKTNSRQAAGSTTTQITHSRLVSSLARLHDG